jgi:hypothetical protein
MDTIKISCESKELKELTLKMVLDIACTMCMGGKIPTTNEKSEVERTGNSWLRKGLMIDLYPVSNNYWAYIKAETETEIVLRFQYRYGTDGVFVSKITTTLCAIFQDVSNFFE